jgi:hypothetical protein
MAGEQSGAMDGERADDTQGMNGWRWVGFNVYSFDALRRFGLEIDGQGIDSYVYNSGFHPLSGDQVRWDIAFQHTA